MTTRVGILGAGLFLPPEIKRNDWWPAEVVTGWMNDRARAPRPPLPTELSEGARRCIAAMAEQAKDPFQGAVERRWMPAGMSIVDMEEAAARIAIERAGVDASCIDLLLTNTTVPEVLLGNPACAVHERLGLRRECLSTHLDVATHSFLMQLALAEGMILAGRARLALLVQSCAPSRLMEPMNVNTPFFGDAATAVVVGPTRGHGILSTVNYTDGRFPRTLIASVPGRPWYEDGRVVLHIADQTQMQQVFLSTADVCRESIMTALARADRTGERVDFFAIHQGTPWLREVVREHAGLSRARSIETFQRTGYLFASMIPASLATAADAKLVSDGDLVVLSGGGPGMTYGATVLEWGP